MAKAALIRVNGARALSALSKRRSAGRWWGLGPPDPDP